MFYRLPVLALLNPTSLVASSGYAAIFVLSVLQSCCVPTSSELTMGFAGVLAFEGKLSLPGAIIAGATGEVVGAYIAWMIGRYGGRAFVDRYGKYVLLSHQDLDRAERWYQRHERWGVFGSRLLPVIRNFVAVPAGVAEVPLVRFGVLTALGSLIWDGSMAAIGYGVGSQWKAVMHGFSDAGYLLGVLVVFAVAFVVYHRYRSYRAATAGASSRGKHSAAARAAQRTPVADSPTRAVRPSSVQVRQGRPVATPPPPPAPLRQRAYRAEQEARRRSGGTD